MTDLTPPDVLGRQPDDYEDRASVRAKTELKHTATQGYDANVIGDMTVSVFKSTDIEDRGGIVLRITSEDRASSFIPHAVNIENGVELHLAGDLEAATLVRVLRGVLASLPDK